MSNYVYERKVGVGSGNNPNNLNTKRKGMPMWFFVDKQLHKRLKVDRSNDLILCWNFGEGKRVVYTLSSTKIKMRPCFSTNQAAEFLGKTKWLLLKYIQLGMLPTPIQALMPGQKKRQTTRYRWSEDDIMAARDFFATRKENPADYDIAEYMGKGPNVGWQNPVKGEVPTRRELRALMNNEEILYVKGKDGEFLPTWRAKDF